MYRAFMIAAMLFLGYIANAQTPAAVIPDFSFEKEDGTAFTRKSMTAGTISFFVFFDTECDHCLHAIEYLEAHRQELLQAKLYLVTLDGKEKARSFLTEHASGLVKVKNTTVLLDTKNQFITRFGPRKYPSLMLYSKQGKLLLYDDDEKKIPSFLKEIREQIKK